ncbi:hypothetical protein DM860_010947 [Cuscuta australis]|uniref:Protein kinase domain-containing protein n=1 Tax=Cuscuta australis TaxID=267555 RepID=A0A328E0C8_9ASTE|nr:hypothetical protein DM860_010947 [Cuscuta australis]
MKRQRDTLPAVLCSAAILCSGRAATDNKHLSPHISSPSNPVASSPENNPTKEVVLGIVVGSCALGVLAAFIVLPWIFCCHSKKKAEKGHNRNSDHYLVSIGGCDLGFDMEGLLRASAEVLGKGTSGTTYKAALEGSAATVEVKRLNDVCVGREEFHLQMEVSGSIRHENVAPLKAYYYSEDEKLTVQDYYSQGSVSAMLHANRGENQFPLDWETRVRIATGAARGIAYIHGANLVHGNIKSSNVFLNSRQYGCVSDFGLATLVSSVAPTLARTTGYRAPEFLDTWKTTQASDVYSFGVLLFELLTGKSPLHSACEDEVDDLVRWVCSIVSEEWSGEVFDVELLKYPNIEEEMVEMLQVGMACAARMPEQRPKMADVVKMVEGIRNQPSTGEVQHQI